MYKDITGIKSCTGCMACVDSCNKGAIVITNVGGILYPQIDKDKCVDCGLCKKVCPANHIPKCAKLEETKVYAVWSNNDDIRLNAASGGFCTQMGVEAIERGGYVATVIMKDNRPEYILTNDIEDLLKSSNSKYVQGNPSGIYRKVRDMLKKETEVLFCGLPCYCAALKNFLKKDYPNLTTIELICSAPPSTDVIDITLEQLNATEFIAFRKKIDGNMWGRDYNIVVKKGGDTKTHKKGENIFYNYFASLMTARRSCTNCQFAHMERIADFAAADFHGYRCKGYEKGVSLVIANNHKAIEKLTNSKGLQVIPETWVKALNSNNRLYNGYDFVRNHPGVLFRKQLAGTGLFKKLCLNKGIYRLFWIPFKAVTKVVIKIKHKKAIRTAINLDKRL